MPSLRRTRRHPPGPRGTFFQGSDAEFRRAPLRFMRRTRDEFGDMVRLRTVWPFSWYLVSHPSYIEHVLTGAFRNYPKAHFARILRVATGPALAALDGDAWSHERRLMQPAFHRSKLGPLVTVMTEAADALAETWLRLPRDNASVEIVPDMIRLALKIGGLTLFGQDVSEDAGVVARSVRAALQEIHERVLYTHTAIFPLPTASRRARMRQIRELDQVVAKVVEARRQDGRRHDDLLDLLVHAQDPETGETNTDERLRHEVKMLIVAGHETSASALAWCWLLIAQHPDVEARLHDEFDRVLGGRIPTLDDVQALTYTRMVIEEAMRLYPPAPYFGRVAVADDEIGGYDVPAGSVVSFSSWVTHRHPDFWDEPDSFAPDRFDTAGAARRPRFAYIPFGGGPRQCIGAHFAMAEVAVVLATIGQRLSLRLPPGEHVEAELLGTLHPRPDLRLIATPRRH
jgi:cytochrome P450